MVTGGTSGLIQALAARWQRRIDDGAVERLERFVELLLVWNTRINLTGAKTAEEIVVEQLPDSFALAELAPRNARVIDVGSGGGLPALPFGILRPDCPLTLVEPRAKRVAFLRTAARELCLPVAVLSRRVEECGASGFDVATAKATFPPSEWLARGADLVSAGGWVIVFAGPDIPEVTENVVQKVEYSAGPGRQRALLAYVPRGT